MVSIFLSMNSEKDTRKKAPPPTLYQPYNVDEYPWVDEKVMRIGSFYNSKDRLEFAHWDMESSSNW